MKLFGSIRELVSAVFRKDSQEITLRPNQATTYTAARDVQLPPQDANAIMVSESASQSLTNKTIDADLNTITNIEDADIKAAAGIDATKIGNGDVSNTELSLLNGLTAIMTPSSTDTLTNKTIDGDDNTLQDIGISSLKTVLADADKVIRRDAAGAVISGNSIPNSSALVTTDSVSILTNKDLDGGTASNARRITLPQDTLANLLALTRKEGTILYANDVDTVYYDNGSTLVPVGSGSGSGGINYIENPSAALNLDGWVASGAGVTVARTTTASELPREPLTAAGIRITPVSGTTDYVRYRFTLGDADKSKLLQIQFAQKTLAGYANGDLIVEMWTNTLSDYTGTYSSLTVSSPDINIGELVKTSTFTSNTSDYYELRIRRTSGTSAVVLQDVNVGPGTPSAVAAITDWQDISSSFSSVGSGLGTIANVEVKGRQIGDSLHIRGYFTTGTVSGADSYIDLSGYTVDTSKLYSGAATPPDARTAIGVAYVIPTTANQTIYPNSRALVVTLNLGSPNRLLFSYRVGLDKFETAIGTDIAPTGVGMVIDVVLPVEEFTSTTVIGALGQSLVSQNNAGLVQRAGQLLGTNTDDNALAGNVGEAKTILVSTPTNVPTSASGFSMGTITLTAGDWDISASVHYALAGATMTGGSIRFQAFYIVSGMTGIPGVNYSEDFNISPAQFNGITLNLPTIRVTSDGTDLNVAGQAVSGTQVVDLQGYIDGFSAGNPQYTCYLLARRVR